MTDRRYSGSCGSSSSSSASNSNSGFNHGYSGHNGYRCGIKTQLHAPSSGRCNNHHHHNNNNNHSICKTGVARPTTAAMHVKKRWKTAAVMLLAVATVSTVTAAFYFNYAATACCAVAPQSSASLLQEPSNTAVADGGPNRSKSVGSSAPRASKLYAVCEIRDRLRSPADRVSTITIIHNSQHKCVILREVCERRLLYAYELVRVEIADTVGDIGL